MGERNLIECAGRAGLPAAYEAFDVENIACVGLAVFLSGEEFLHLAVLFGDKVAVEVKNLVESVDEVHKACRFLVGYGYIAGGFIGDMHVVALAYKAIDCPAHGDYVVVGVGGEYDYTLWVWGGSLRAVGVVGVGLTSGPAGDGALEVIEDLYIELVSCAVALDERVESGIDIVGCS